MLSYSLIFVFFFRYQFSR